jgi:hypothetical protein
MSGALHDIEDVLQRLADGHQPSGYAEYRCPHWWKPHTGSLPGWRVFKSGDDGLFRAWLPGTTPLVIAQADTPENLRDAVRDQLRKDG